MKTADGRAPDTDAYDPDADDERLGDEDLGAILCRDGMGGYGGLTWEQYLDTPDRVLRDVYFAERDDDHNLVTLRQRRRRLLEDGDVSGRPERAGRELPRREELCIPAEAWDVNPLLARTPTGQGYVLMWWSIYRRRQAEGVLTEDGTPITDEWILERWKKKAGRKDQDRQEGKRRQASKENSPHSPALRRTRAKRNTP